MQMALFLSATRSRRNGALEVDDLKAADVKEKLEAGGNKNMGVLGERSWKLAHVPGSE
jgi:hypothetical protein